MEEEKKKTIDSKKLSKIAVILLIAVIVILGGTFAWLRIGLNGTNTNKVKAGLLDLIVDESPTSTEVVRLERAVPQSYRQGLTNAPYRFTLVNNSTIDTDYTITLEDLYEGADANLTANDKIADNLIRYILVKNDDELVATNSKLLSTGRTIDSGTIAGKVGNEATRIPYTLYVWIDSRAGDNGTESDIMSKIFNARLSVTAEQHHQSATPVQAGPNFGTGTTFRPTYFAFGYYDYDNYPAFPTTTEIPSGTRSFVGKDDQENKGVCINIDGAIHCFQSHNYEYESEHVQQVFQNSQTLENVNCGWDYDYDYSYWRCEAYDLKCDIYDNGMVLCDDYYRDEDNYDGGDYGGECWVDENSHVGCTAH